MATNRGGKRVNRNLTPAQKQQIRLDKKYGKGTKATGSRFKNPLDVQVDSAILGQTTPYTEASKQADRQAADEKAYLERLGAATQSELDGIGSSIQAKQNTALGAAATTQTFDADRYKRNLDFLNGILGGSVTDMGSLQGMGAIGQQQNLVNNTATASELALNGQAMQRDLGTMRSSEAMRNRESIGQRETARVEAKKGYAATIASIRANREALKRQLYGENLKNDIMRQEAAQNKTQAEWERGFQERQLQQNQNQFDSNLAAEGSAAALDSLTKGMGDAEKNAKEAAKANAKNAEKWRKIAAGVHTDIFRVPAKDILGKPTGGFSVVRSPLTQSVDLLMNRGVPPAVAFEWGFEWTKGNEPTYGLKSPKSRVKKAQAILRMMRTRKVPDSTAKRLINSVYGAQGWSMATGQASGPGLGN